MRGRKNKQESGKRRFSLFYGRLTVHPLFLLFGIWHAFTGEFLSFFSTVICALLHELAHASAAARIGFRLQRLVLMPYGAAISMDLEGVSAKDEIMVALAGPLCNFLIAGLFLALWWCFPSLYPYTETAFTSSLSLALINLLPAFPLDGGRVLRCLLVLTFNAYMPPANSQKRAKIISNVITAVLCAVGIVFSVITAIKGSFNPTLLAFAVFLLLGLFPKREAAYTKLDFSDKKAFERGAAVLHVAVSERCTVKKALSFLSDGQYLMLDVYSGDEKYLGSISQGELHSFFIRRNLYAPLKEYFCNNC